MTELLRWIILAPLVGVIINGLLVRSKNGIVSGAIGVAGALASAVFAVMAVLQVKAGGGVPIADAWFTWFEAGFVKVPFHLEVTAVTATMLLVITGIGTLIHVFAAGYMSHDESPWRFFAYLNLFLAAMLVLVLSSGLVGVFMGWEGVGVCSYLLIGYWYKEPKNSAAGMKAFLVNRIGDLGFLLALFAIYSYAGTAQISELVNMVSSGASQVPAWVWLVGVGGLFWASTGKSAQWPLYIWLPDAMAGPTPVSALIHAATMVTSGIFVAVRLWPLYAGQPAVLEVVLWVGIATAWLGALIALKQDDIKKVLAYSTVSQLGFMFAALGAGAPDAALFHVVTHACFKALLFLSAGSVIHGMHEKQDMLEMGGLKKHLPLTHIAYLCGTLAIIGFPLTSGFFSKDLILARAFEHSPAAFVALLGAALLTAFYMVRSYALTFLGAPRSKEADHAHESSPIMTVPLLVLAALALFVGWLQTPGVIAENTGFTRLVSSSIYAAHFSVEEPGSRSTEWVLILIPTLLSLAVAWFSLKTFSNYKKVSSEDSFVTKVLKNKFYVDEAYDFVFVRPLKFLSDALTELLDTRLINGVLHLSKDSVRISGQVLSLFHTGSLQVYAWYLTVGIGVALLATWMVLK